MSIAMRRNILLGLMGICMISLVYLMSLLLEINPMMPVLATVIPVILAVSWKFLGKKITLSVFISLTVVVSIFYLTRFGFTNLLAFKEYSLTLDPATQVAVGGAIVIFLIVSMIMLMFPAIIGLTAVAGVAGAAGSKLSAGADRKPIIFQVPSNYEWVIRRSFGSYPGKPSYDLFEEEKEKLREGTPEALARVDEIERIVNYNDLYQKKSEGFSYWIPFWHVDEGIYNLDLRQKDIKEITVNSKDKIDIDLDLQLTSRIHDSIRFAISMEGETVEEKEEARKVNENDLVHTAANNACSKYTAEELQGLICKIYRNDESEITRQKYWSTLRKHFGFTEKDENDQEVDFFQYERNIMKKIDFNGSIDELWDMILTKHSTAEAVKKLVCQIYGDDKTKEARTRYWSFFHETFGKTETVDKKEVKYYEYSKDGKVVRIEYDATIPELWEMITSATDDVNILKEAIYSLHQTDTSQVIRDRYFKLLKKDGFTRTKKDGANEVKFYLYKLGSETKRIEKKDGDINDLWEMAMTKFKKKTEFVKVEIEADLDDPDKKKFKSVKREYFEVLIPLGDEIKTELKNLYIRRLYGIEIGQVGIKKVLTPDDMSEALQRERAAKVEKRTAQDEVDAVKITTDTLGIENEFLKTIYGIFQTFADARRGAKSKKGK